MALLALFALFLFPAHAFASNVNLGTGSLTVSGLVSGDTVNVYKVVDTSVDATTNAKSYAYNASFSAGMASMEIPTVAASTTDSNTAAGRTFSEKASQVQANGSIAATKSQAAAGSSVTLSGLDAGYYLIKVTPGTSSAGTVYQLTSVEIKVTENAAGSTKFATATSTSVTVKKTSVAPTKLANGQATLTTMGVGEKIPYTITTNYPVFAANATNTTFTISDTLNTALELDASTITVKSGQTTLSKNTHYTLSTTNGITITFVYAQMKTYEGQPIEVSYKAAFKDLTSTTTHTLSNTATVTYSTTPYGTDVTATSQSTANVNYHTLTITKVSSTDTNTVLPNATFKLYKANTNGTSTVKDGSTTVQVDDLGVTRTTSTTGVATFIGLSEGTYYLQETVAPVGYVLPSAAVKVEVSSGSAADMTQQITNVANPLLPTTGGIGTIVLTLLGILLLVGALIFFMRNRKKEHEQQAQIS